MEGVIINFRKSFYRMSTNQMVVSPKGVDSKEKAKTLIGKKVIYNTGKKDIVGEITSTHGNKGNVRVKFETGMPGQAVGAKVKIN